MTTDLEARIARLEQANRRLSSQLRLGGSLAILLVAGLSVAMTFGNASRQDGVSELIRTRMVQILSADDQVVAVLGSQDLEGESGGRLSLSGGGSPESVLLAGTPVGGWVATQGKAGSESRSILTPHCLRITVPSEEANVSLGLSLHNELVCSLGRGGGRLTLTGEKEGGYISSFGSGGRPAFVLYGSENGSWLGLHRPDGEMGILMDAGGPDDPGSRVTLRNRTDEPVVTLGVDEYGHGEVGAWNREGKGRTLTPAK